MFKNGDLVTRDGTDVHVVSHVSEDGVVADFICVVEPRSGWCRKWDVESNLCRRYSLIAAWVDIAKRIGGAP